MKLDEYVNDRSREGADVKIDIEALKRQQAELQAQYDDMADAFETFLTEVYPNG